MILSTTDVIQGEIVSAYLGIVTAEVLFNFQVTIIEGALGSKAVEALRERQKQAPQVALAALKQSQEDAIAELQKRAGQLEANAVIGIDIAMINILGNGYLIRATGTAVRFGKP
jgi:uncharacterized protein YbjQ (UPF0145 family)